MVDSDSVLKFVNAKRSSHRSPPLVWDEALASSCQDWASKERFSHSGNPNVSENLFISTLLDVTFKNAIDAWYGEEKMYLYSNPGFSSSTGHFTAMVWKSSSKVGAAIQRLPNGMYLYVMQFGPKGNINTPRMFAANVTPQTM